MQKKITSLKLIFLSFFAVYGVLLWHQHHAVARNYISLPPSQYSSPSTENLNLNNQPNLVSGNLKGLSCKSPVEATQESVAGIPIWKASIKLNCPDVILTIVPEKTVDEYGGFASFARNRNVAFASNTAFKDEKESVDRTWTIMAEGKFLQGENSTNFSNGSTFGLKSNNEPEVVNRSESPSWESYWFALTSSPRLIDSGISCSEGLVGCSSRNSKKQRSAIGISQDKQVMFHIITDEARGKVGATKLSEIMRKIGCYDAILLEGGDGVLQAVDGKAHIRDTDLVGEEIRAPVIVAYDAIHPAPDRLWESYNLFLEKEKQKDLSQSPNNR